VRIRYHSVFAHPGFLQFSARAQSVPGCPILRVDATVPVIQYHIIRFWKRWQCGQAGFVTFPSLYAALRGGSGVAYVSHVAPRTDRGPREEVSGTRHRCAGAVPSGNGRSPTGGASLALRLLWENVTGLRSRKLQSVIPSFPAACA
jgi:hypothetical protein